MHDVRHHRLPGDLRVVTVVRPGIHRAIVSARVKVGSRHESRATNGVTHLLEHMLFRGTERLPRAALFNDAVESLGASFNAATHGDFTLFEMVMPPDAVDEATALLGEVFRTPVFSDLALEKGIVREEINEDLDEDGQDINADNVCRAQLFRGHPLGWPITGTTSTIEKMSLATLQAHHRRFCVARNMVVTLVGPGTHDAMLAAVTRSFAGLAEGDEAATTEFAPKGITDPLTVVTNRDSQSAVRVAFVTPGATDPDVRAMDMVFRILDDGMSTRLHRRICDERGLAYEISAGVEFFEEVGVADVASSVAPKSLVALVEEVLAVLEGLVKEGPTHDEMAKAQRRYAFSLAAMEDDPEHLSDFYGTSELFGRRPTAASRLAEVQALTADDVRRAARRCLDPKYLHITVVGEVDTKSRRALRAAARAYGERLAESARPEVEIASP